ncbi:uncharacterized protein BYT42DRAFT_229452 [Radiomyces spectabilis]|uniref:uncharacterized protein n=1 Tax=Radiomyces spectabilis TaxID=64574 RepID=UPI00221F7051|nr:uncharacterized protein BYT42DRAFT_229452 [Radiomyces spectabilis]KAI8388289.1 hypothetical protein BYT42DRAFT_229452 [Radiomyces spectabilis]
MHFSRHTRKQNFCLVFSGFDLMLDPIFLGLDPLFSIDVKLLIKDIHSCAPVPGYQDLYLFQGHTIKSVEIYGIIVAVEQNHAMLIYQVDDGTGTVPCCLWKNSTGSITKTLPLGTCVHVLGRITDYKDMRQVTTFSLSQVHDPNREVLHALEAMVLRKTVYAEPYKVPVQIQQNADKLKEQMQADKDGEHLLSKEATETSTIKTENAFQQRLLLYLREHAPTSGFPYTFARADETLRESARQLLHHKYGESPTERQISELFAHSTTALVKSGDLLEVESNSGVYQVLTSERLQNTIETIVREAESKLSPAYGNGSPQECCAQEKEN